MIALARLNELPRAAFRDALADIFEHSPWVPERAWSQRPFAGVDKLHGALCAVLAQASDDEKLCLIRAHPELAGKAAVRKELTASSQAEQAGAGLDHCSREEFETLTRLNAEYTRRFGMPFILAVRGHTRGSIIENLQHRVQGDAAGEFAEALRQIERIALFRLKDRVAESQ